MGWLLAIIRALMRSGSEPKHTAPEPEFLPPNHDSVTVPSPNHDSITGRSTIFGLNYNGSIDRTDNGEGYFGYNTRDKSLIGVSLPIPVVDQSIGNHRLQSVVKSIKNKEYTVHVIYGDKSIIAPIVDVGPAAWTGNAIDLTYGAVQALSIPDNSIVSYEILNSKGDPIQIKGWKK